MNDIALHIESLIFSAAEPITVQEMKNCLEQLLQVKVKESKIEKTVATLQKKYASEDFAIEIVAIRGGYIFLTKGAHHNLVSEYLKMTTTRKLSRAALETLAIIAYRQPVTKPEVESIRGVNCDYTIQKLLEKELVSIKGRDDGPGRPILYETSQKFMDYFGLNSLRDLPKLKDLNPAVNELGDAESIVEEALRNKSDN